MLQDPPTKGDPSFGMFASHGKDWVAWQELWLQGLRRLHGREVFVISGEAYEEFSTGYHFKRKFQLKFVSLSLSLSSFTHLAKVILKY